MADKGKSQPKPKPKPKGKGKEKKTDPLPQRKWVRKDRKGRKKERKVTKILQRPSFPDKSLAQDAKESESKQQPSNEVLIGDWIKNNNHPIGILQVLQTRDILAISDFGKPSKADMDEIFNLLKAITHQTQFARLKNDIINYRLVFKYDDPSIIVASEPKPVMKYESEIIKELRSKMAESKEETKEETKEERKEKGRDLIGKIDEIVGIFAEEKSKSSKGSKGSKVEYDSEEKMEYEPKGGVTKGGEYADVAVKDVKASSVPPVMPSKDGDTETDDYELKLKELKEAKPTKKREKTKRGASKLVLGFDSHGASKFGYKARKGREAPKVQLAGLDTALSYLGFYKIVILDYLHHKRIEQEPIIETSEIEKGKSYSTQITVYIPIQQNYVPIHGFSCAENEVWAEFYAFKNLFDQLVVNGSWHDRKTLNGLVRKYKLFKLDPNRNREVLWWYFYGFKKYRDSGEYEKAEYFYNKNISDALGGPSSWVNVRISKQSVWVDGHHYLFAEEGETDEDIELILTKKNKDLVFVWMKSYNSRKEFFGSIMKFGYLKALQYLSQNST